MLRGDLLRHVRVILLLAASTLAGALAADFVHQAVVKQRNDAAARAASPEAAAEHAAAGEFMLP